VTQLLDSALVIIALAALAWGAVATIVLAACRTAAAADLEMKAQDEAVAMAGSLGWLLSQAPSGKDVTDGPQQDLHVPPQRPVGHIEVIHRTHLA
jgi:hypothetical protein